MAIQKLFTDEDGGQLITYTNHANKCYLCVGTDVLNPDSTDYNAHIVLDSDDLTELINELQYIRQQINKENF